MKPIAHNKIRRMPDGTFLIRFAVWKRTDNVVVSVYALTGLQTLKWEIAHRESFAYGPMDYNEAGKTLAMLWANFNGIGDYVIYRGVRPPVTFHPSKLGEQS